MAKQEENKISPLEQTLLEIGSLNGIGKGIQSSKDPKNHYQNYMQLAEILSNGNQEDFKNIYGDIRQSPEEAFRYASEGMISKAKNAEDLYKQGKGKISQEIASSMNDTIKDSKSKAEAAQRLVPYFTNLIDVPELDQPTLDEIAQQDTAKRIGVSMNFSARGSRDKYMELQQRAYAAELIKEVKDKSGNLKGYEIDYAKLDKAMDKVVYGATVYTNSKQIEAYKKQEAEKAKSKK